MLRNLAVIGLLICLAAIGGAKYIEYQYMIGGCPLCILQRLMFYALAVLFFCGVLVSSRAKAQRKTRDLITVNLYGISIFVVALLGALLAERQLWLQYFAPPQAISCSASLERLIAVHPLFDALRIAITGSSECSNIDFTIFGLSLAVWAFGLFLVLLGFGITLLRRR